MLSLFAVSEELCSLPIEDLEGEWDIRSFGVSSLIWNLGAPSLSFNICSCRNISNW
jgi:hypothetical protein